MQKGLGQRYRQVLHLAWNAGKRGEWRCISMLLSQASRCYSHHRRKCWRLGETDHRSELPSSSV